MKYYKRTIANSEPHWTHELIEVTVWSSVHRGLTFYNNHVSAFNHEGMNFTCTPISGTLTPVSKDHFEMLWNLYYVTDK